LLEEKTSRLGVVKNVKRGLPGKKRGNSLKWSARQEKGAPPATDSEPAKLEKKGANCPGKF